MKRALLFFLAATVGGCSDSSAAPSADASAADSSPGTHYQDDAQDDAEGDATADGAAPQDSGEGDVAADSTLPEDAPADSSEDASVDSMAPQDSSLPQDSAAPSDSSDAAEEISDALPADALLDAPTQDAQDATACPPLHQTPWPGEACSAPGLVCSYTISPTCTAVFACGQESGTWSEGFIPNDGEVCGIDIDRWVAD
jgi:hypothetical protein